MTDWFLNELEKSINEDRFFDFIANNYCQMSKEELKQIIMELDWFIYTQSPTSQKEAEQYVLNVLKGEE